MCFHLHLVFFVVLMSPVMSVRFSDLSISLQERERVRVAVVLDESCPVSVCLCVCVLAVLQCYSGGIQGHRVVQPTATLSTSPDIFTTTLTLAGLGLMAQPHYCYLSPHLPQH